MSNGARFCSALLAASRTGHRTEGGPLRGDLPTLPGSPECRLAKITSPRKVVNALLGFPEVAARGHGANESRGQAR